ncbi:hypothetical protein ACFYUD_27785 [Nocardia tengchongensis]|uniref:hypothetical protein n=1 Tax=Nocardia tengchongensis TaxID=2055889 RepID=UPI003675DB42
MTMTMRRAAIAAASLTAALPLAIGTAGAASDSSISLNSGSPDNLGCQVTTETCLLSTFALPDYTTPVTFSVDGTVLGTSPINPNCHCPYPVEWIPQKAGRYTVTTKQGTRNDTLTVTIVDYNSPQAFVKRYIGPYAGSS